MTATRNAPAKLNLALSVGPARRSPESPRETLHPIASWFHAIELSDTVTVTRVPPGRSRLEILWMPDAPRASAIDWRPDDDLARLAAELVIAESREDAGAHIVIEKRIPTGAGLGGGSSDAAAAMLAMNAQLDRPLPHDTLVRLSRRIGSDIAYFLSAPAGGGAPPPAFVGGFGDQWQPLARRDTPLALILPPFGCPTGAVYQAFDELTPSPLLREGDVCRLIDEPPESLTRALFNDLTVAAEHVRPELAAIRHAIEPITQVHLTGSGSALFALCPNDDAPAICAQIESAAPGVRAVPTRLA